MKAQLLTFAIVLMAFLGCDKIDKLTQFNIEYNEEVVVPSATGIDLPITLFTPAIATNSESQFSVNDTRKDLIEFISLKTMTLNLTEPADGDFGFLKSISIAIKAEGLDEIEIAWLNDIPADPGKVLELETSDADLQEYIKKDNFTLDVSTVVDELIDTDHHIDIKSIFFVDAKILGI